jgi:hypothetical protein
VAAASGQCRRHTARAAAPSEHFARLKAWELIAQGTGNWPFQRDRLDGMRAQCRPAGTGWQCRVSLRVCRAA